MKILSPAKPSVYGRTQSIASPIWSEKAIWVALMEGRRKEGIRKRKAAN